MSSKLSQSRIRIGSFVMSFLFLLPLTALMLVKAQLRFRTKAVFDLTGDNL
ncbi:hypothetical protein DFH08DRAFT_966749 [Mycena albidolilacea]|uniref:Uncharacterized protein n=1 Tax=Mycena albidolilacea TaxID=1033008 RepID=A0AAD6ZN90_9AGAR|nr:hypothetical protein DFH08DRAFT_966749 [Mycena albidolilacea]